MSATENLLGTPIGGSAADRSVCTLMAGEAGHAEVCEFDAIIGGDEDVGGLNVAMDDGAAVRDGQSNGNVGGPFASAGKGDAALGDDFFEWLAFHQFHDEVGSVRGLLNTHVMNSNDGWMRELADHAGFAKEAVARVPAGEFGREKLDGHGAVDERVMAANDSAMGTGAEGFEDLVATDLQG